MISKREPDENKIAEALEEIEFQLNLLNTHLTSNKHLAADDMTLADMLLIPNLFCGDDARGRHFLGTAAPIARWQKGMASRPSFVDTMPPFSVAATIQENANVAN